MLPPVLVFAGWSLYSPLQEYNPPRTRLVKREARCREDVLYARLTDWPPSFQNPTNGVNPLARPTSKLPRPLVMLNPALT